MVWEGRGCEAFPYPDYGARELLMSVDIHHLTPNDLTLMEALLTTFGEAFNEVDTYTANRPGEGYLRQLLAVTRSLRWPL